MDNFADDSVNDAGQNYVSFEQMVAANGRPINKRNASTKSSVPTPALANSSKRPSNSPPDNGPSAARNKRIGRQLKTSPAKPSSRHSTTQHIDFILNSKDFVCFFGRENFLSNFFVSHFMINGHRYFSVEHFYEAVKLFHLVGPNAAVQLKNVQDPCAAKSISRRMISEARVDRKRVEQWRRECGISVVYLALTEKFSRGSDLAGRLVETGTALLAQTNPSDKLWAVNMQEKDFSIWMQKNDKLLLHIPVNITPENADLLPSLGRNGKNLLGFLLMQLRRQLQSGESGRAVPHPMATIEEEHSDDVVIVEDDCSVMEQSDEGLYTVENEPPTGPA